MHTNQMPLDWSGSASGAYHPSVIEQSHGGAACGTAPTPCVRARRTDPETSYDAAARAAAFASSHAGRILAALAGGQLSAHEIASRSGLSIVQVDRRMHEVAGDGKARVVIGDDGKPMKRGGSRVWEAC